MNLSGVHLLLTYHCNYECDHCFVWSGPTQVGTMSLEQIREILRQSKDLGTVEWIYFEGGEPFLFYAVLCKGVEMAARLGFKVGIVSNSYWATDGKDAEEYLRPFAGVVEDLSVSSDLYHANEKTSREAKNACTAAKNVDARFPLVLEVHTLRVERKREAAEECRKQQIDNHENL